MEIILAPTDVAIIWNKMQDEEEQGGIIKLSSQ
jgi:hypothetical protein